jgi:hypothetical protein
MNLNEILVKLSTCSDVELLQIIKTGIARYAGYIDKETQAEITLKRKRNQRCASVTLFTKGSNRIIFESTPSEKLSSYPQDQSLFEINNLIESIFKKLIQKFKETSWVRGDNKAEIHIAALRQFWLDCYVADTNFLSLLLSALPNKIWINLSGFKKSIESTRGVSAFAFFSLKRYDKKLQKDFLIQKMLCNNHSVFFSFCQVEFGLFITRQNLVKILSLVNIKEKTQLHIWADQLITGSNKVINSGKDYIGFPEFFKFIRS